MTNVTVGQTVSVCMCYEWQNKPAGVAFYGEQTRSATQTCLHWDNKPYAHAPYAIRHIAKFCTNQALEAIIHITTIRTGPLAYSESDEGAREHARKIVSN